MPRTFIWSHTPTQFACAIALTGCSKTFRCRPTCATFTRPWLDLTPDYARQRFESELRLGELAGKDVLCLAGGGGQIQEQVHLRPGLIGGEVHDHLPAQRLSIERGRAFLEAGADCVFVPGRLDIATIRRLVDGIGERRVSLIGLPGTPPQADLAAAGVARLSFGPWSQRIALTALAETGAELLSGASLPDGVLALT